jgi:hypothetical protein
MIYLLLVVCTCASIDLSCYGRNGFAVNVTMDYQRERRVAEWGAATFQGITIGKSSSLDLKRKWGKPDSTGNWDWDDPEKPKYLLHHYRMQERYQADVTVEIETKTDKIIAISMSPDKMTLEQAVKIFGKDYVKTRYAFCDCDLGDGSPIYELPEVGSLLYIEYRKRGIAMAVNDLGMITTIQFVNKPIGLKYISECWKIPGCKPGK